VWVPGLAAVVVLGAALVRFSRLVAPALALAGVEYVVWLELDGPRLDAASPLAAAGLVLSAELAFRSLDARGPVPPAEGENARRAGIALAVAALGALAGLVILVAADAAPPGGAALAILAAAAGAVALLLLGKLAERSVG
jgi:hypothetical protein